MHLTDELVVSDVSRTFKTSSIKTGRTYETHLSVKSCMQSRLQGNKMAAARKGKKRPEVREKMDRYGVEAIRHCASRRQK